jgi:hypothetical protein
MPLLIRRGEQSARRHRPGIVDCIAARSPARRHTSNRPWDKVRPFTMRFPVQVVVGGDDDDYDDDAETIDVPLSLPDYVPLLRPRPIQHRSTTLEPHAHYRSHLDQGSPSPLDSLCGESSSSSFARISTPKDSSCPVCFPKEQRSGLSFLQECDRDGRKLVQPVWPRQEEKKTNGPRLLHIFLGKKI